MPDEKAIHCPFVISRDTREKIKYEFKDITVRKNKKDTPLIIKTEDIKLEEGDYSIQGMNNIVSCERKSCQDLINSVAHNRERFVRELERLQKLKWSCVLIEQSWEETLKYCKEKTQFNPRSLDSSIIAWMIRYPKTMWVFRPSRWAAEKTCYKILDRFWREYNGRNKPN